VRTKGHNFERLVARMFQSLGYNAKTSRATSKFMDDCGVDIVGTPYIIQCKAGYARSRPKFEEEYRYTKTRLQDGIGVNHPINQLPIVVIHQLDVAKGRGKTRNPEDTYVMLTLEDFMKITSIAFPDQAQTQTLDIL